MRLGSRRSARKSRSETTEQRIIASIWYMTNDCRFETKKSFIVSRAESFLLSERSELNRNDSRNTFRESERQGILPHLNVEKQRNGSDFTDGWSMPWRCLFDMKKDYPHRDDKSFEMMLVFLSQKGVNRLSLRYDAGLSFRNDGAKFSSWNNQKFSWWKDCFLETTPKRPANCKRNDCSWLCHLQYISRPECRYRTWTDLWQSNIVIIISMKA